MSKELRDILDRVRNLEDKGSAVLATVVSLDGSGYRLPGARMLIARDGSVIGTVSGGCLEADLLERAQAVFDTGTPTVVTYDTRTKDDSVFSLNMGCNGVLRVLIEPIDGNELFGLIEEVFRARKPVTVATVITSDDPTHPIGEHITVGTDRADRQLPSANVESFIEILRPPFHIFIFGAGFDAVPVVRLAKELGWHVTVVDHRPGYLDAKRLSHPDELLELRPEQLTEHLNIEPNAAAVVMTHNFEHDREILAFLLTKNLAYIGALGPKKRTERILAELEADGGEIDSDPVSKLHAPVGLDIGAQTPESIALAIIAEIQATIAGRDAGFLRNRQAPIYDRRSEVAEARA